MNDPAVQLDRNARTRLQALRLFAYRLGVGLVVLGLLWLIAAVLGLDPTGIAADGLGLRPIASVPVAGCLIAAVASWDT